MNSYNSARKGQTLPSCKGRAWIDISWTDYIQMNIKHMKKHPISLITAAAAAAAKSLQSCPTLCDPIDGSPPGSPVPGILQARTLEWVAISKCKLKPQWGITVRYPTITMMAIINSQVSTSVGKDVGGMRTLTDWCWVHWCRLCGKQSLAVPQEINHRLATWLSNSTPCKSTRGNWKHVHTKIYTQMLIAA